MSSNLYDKTTHKLIPIAGNSESTAASLGSLSDVVITSPTNGQHLTFDLATSQWKNADAQLPTIEINDISDVTIISVSNGQILKWNSTTTKWENSSFNDITSLGAIPNVDISQVQDGDILVYDTTTGKWINTALDLSDYQTKNLSSSIAGASTVEGALDAEETAIENEISTRATLGSHNIFDNKLVSQTSNNVIYTVNSDKSVSITVNSAPESNTGVILGYVNVKAGKSYTLSGGINANTRVDLRNSNYSMWTDNAENKEVTSPSQSYSVETFTPSNDATLMVYVRIGSGAQTGNVGTVYPMLRLATDSDSTYQPFAMSNKEITPYIQSISNPNLVDNSWFTINQRGESSYTGTSNFIAIDRWRFTTSLTVTVNADNTITVTNSSTENASWFAQSFVLSEYGLKTGDIVTQSIMMSDGTIYSHTAPIPVPDGVNDKTINEKGIHSIRIQQLNNERYHCVFFVSANSNATIRAIKLEKGKVSTLAMDTAPNYQKELAKCQRYFVRLKGSIGTGFFQDTNIADCVCPIPVSMRAKPTLILNNGIGMVLNDGTTGLINNVTVWNEQPINCIGFTGTGVTHAIGATFRLFANQNNSLDLSAEI